MKFAILILTTAFLNPAFAEPGETTCAQLNDSREVANLLPGLFGLEKEGDALFLGNGSKLATRKLQLQQNIFARVAVGENVTAVLFNRTSDRGLKIVVRMSGDMATQSDSLWLWMTERDLKLSSLVPTACKR